MDNEFSDYVNVGHALALFAAKPLPSQLFYSDLYSISNRFLYWASLNAQTVPYWPS